MMKRFFCLFLLVILMQTQVLAISFKPYAGEFAYLGAGPRGTAMGGAFTALTNDVTSGYWNPAGLMETEGLQAIFMHSKQFISSIQNNYLAMSTPYDENSAIGFSLYYLTVIDNKDSRYSLVDNKVESSLVTLFNTGDYIFTASYARTINQQMNWGVNVKIIYRDFEIENATGIGFDAGVKYTIGSLKLGAVARDFTGTILAWSTNNTELITPSLKLGVAYTLTFDDFNLDITPALDINILNENRDFSAQASLASLSGDLMAGIEISYDNIIALRAGVDDLQRFTTGIGISIPKVNIDYAFTSFENELGNIHRISIHTFFGDILKR